MDLRRKYQDRFPPHAELAGLHYDRSYEGNYFGHAGAIAIAHRIEEAMKREGEDEKKAFLLLLSTYYSAAGSALAQWGSRKWKLWLFIRGVSALRQATYYAATLLSTPGVVERGYFFFFNSLSL